MNLFDTLEDNNKQVPLAELMRPKNLEDYLGQTSVINPNSPFYKLLMAKRLFSFMLWGPPGCGKTTLLRDLIRQKSVLGQGSVSGVDERQELFPIHKGQACFSTGSDTDVLSGCPKAIGIDAVLRSMSPTWIAVDEITAETDCEALLHAGWCGVNLIATAHAGSLEDLRSRPLYQNLLQCRLFRYAVVLQRDKTWTIERL